MNREEYAFAYNINGTGMSGIITMTNPPKLVCYCDEENSKTILNALNPSLPPAEGAEAILVDVYGCKDIEELKRYFIGEISLTMILDAMNKFATLHAQRIADKMVEERMEQYKAQFKDRPNPLEVNPYDSKGIKRIRNRKIH